MTAITTWQLSASTRRVCRNSSLRIPLWTVFPVWVPHFPLLPVLGRVLQYPGKMMSVPPTVNPNGEPGNPEDGDAAPTNTPSFAEQYCNLFAGMQEVAKEVGRSLVTVSVFVNGIDWLSNPYQTESQTTGVLIGQNETKLLLLVNLDRIQSASRICTWIHPIPISWCG